MYSAKEVELTRTCSPCPGISKLDGHVCSQRGHCNDTRFAATHAQEIPNRVSSIANLSAHGNGHCICPEPFAGESCEFGQCNAGSEYTKEGELYSCKPCAPGYFKPEAGNDQICEPCQSGRFAEHSGSSSCEACVHAWWRMEPSQQKDGCHFSHINEYEAIPLLVVSTLLFFVLPFACGLPTEILDIATLDDRTILTTNGRHHLLARHGKPVKVCLRHTGVPWLDEKVCYVQVEDYSRLLLCNSEGSLLKGTQSESSKGKLILHRHTALRWKGWLGFPFMGWLLFFLLGISIIVFMASAFQDLPQFQPTLLELLAIGAGCMICCCLHFYRSCLLATTPMRDDLKNFTLKVRTLCKSQSCSRGPTRAITGQQLFDFFSFFQPRIKARNMYYVCANIITPLTEPSRLSYAEFAGPCEAVWFVSHFWGTSFRHFVQAVQKHEQGEQGYVVLDLFIQ